jgi:uncharacterized membrane protein
MGTHSPNAESGSVFVDTIGALTVLLAAGLATTLSSGHPLRTVLTMGAILFVPGYALTLLAFPAADGATADDATPLWKDENPDSSGPASLRFTNRLALAFGLSVVVLPLVAMVIAVLSLPYTSAVVFSVVTSFTVPVLVAGTVRRLRTPTTARYAVGTSVSDLLTRVFPGRDGVDRWLNIALAAAVLLTVGALTFTLVAPQDGNAYTQVSLLTEDGSGELSASGYPTNMTRDEPTDLVLSVKNREDQRMDYTIVVQAQTVDTGGVSAASELRRLETTVPGNETRSLSHDLSLPRVGDDQRVVYLVYRNEVPSEPAIDNAYRTVYFWTNVSAPDRQ